MGYYSFVVIAPQPLGIPKPFVALDTGVNTFNAVVDNIDTFLEYLDSEGVVVTRYHQLSSGQTSSGQTSSGQTTAPGDVPLLEG